ncbi:MAG: YiiD C-terminal domain-containing protein [Gammaproteobacteria bacterium]
MSGLPAALDAAGAKRLEAYLHKHIPLVRHMRIHVAACDTTGLTLTAPLAANINHQATAFGGSLESLAMLACWGLVWLLLESELEFHIVVAESRMRFLRPVSATLRAHCAMPDAAARQLFLDTLQRRRKARIELQARIVQADVRCAEFDGRFVAYR